ncbi:N-acetylmuramoyl-L-alanine amidase [Rhodohalobacter sp. SW132]|uniref:N-acetylmuramoyl-L-alanine amidase n=1 Tax=Rhodohalobacter sp. SW132 TaxID=2293433 RepID=UPI000E278A0B|nr:N-acetylmuramoyl-L-alanine amidase [Rhodohalobacter sp. SW132]
MSKNKMSVIRLIMALFVLLTVSSFSERLYSQSHRTISAEPQTISLDYDTRLPGSKFEWHREILPDENEVLKVAGEVSYVFEIDESEPFTGLSIGWNSDGDTHNADEFRLRVRSGVPGEEWPEWVHTTGYLEPGDSPSGLYWSMLYITPDGSAHTRFEVEITVPENSSISYLTITAADARLERDSEIEEKSRYQTDHSGQPEITSRAGWWGNLPAGELEPEYTPRQISISHAAVHHTVTANRPPNSAQVVRQIWDWHVNDNGWIDIGYNFLIDHNGRIFQGRYNPWLQSTDVQGAHAGNANSSSVGIALMGQFEPGANPQVGDPESLALDALVRLVSWRFDQNGIDPLGSGVIPVNPSGVQNVPTIFGHRDVSGTACPGENLHALLPDIRNGVNIGEPVAEEVPFDLHQNYPNPFRTTSTIPYELDEESMVEIILYSVRGDKIRELFSGLRGEGGHEHTFDMNGLSSGVYYYELISGEFRQMKKMVYIR